MNVKSTANHDDELSDLDQDQIDKFNHEQAKKEGSRKDDFIPGAKD
jgi:hypothetical protein